MVEQSLIEVSKLLSEAKQALENLQKKLVETEGIKECVKKAMFYREEKVPIMEVLRKSIDELELLVDSNLWPVPSYGAMLFK